MPMTFQIIIDIIIIALGVSAFLFLPRKTQIQKFKEWLLYACTMAEDQFGSGTGEIKLRYVYDLFISKFPFLSKIISFQKFSEYVDEVLLKMKESIKNNNQIDEGEK